MVPVPIAAPTPPRRAPSTGSPRLHGLKASPALRLQRVAMTEISSAFACLRVFQYFDGRAGAECLLLLPM